MFANMPIQYLQAVAFLSQPASAWLSRVTTTVTDLERSVKQLFEESY